MVSRIKNLGRMNVAEKRKPQDGRIKTRMAGEKEVELRLSTMPTAFGEKLVMRIFDPDVLLKSFDQLGFSADDLRRWAGMTGQPMQKSRPGQQTPWNRLRRATGVVPLGGRRAAPQGGFTSTSRACGSTTWAPPRSPPSARCRRRSRSSTAAPA